MRACWQVVTFRSQITRARSISEDTSTKTSCQRPAAPFSHFFGQRLSSEIKNINSYVNEIAPEYNTICARQQRVPVPPKRPGKCHTFMPFVPIFFQRKICKTKVPTLTLLPNACSERTIKILKKKSEGDVRRLNRFQWRNK